MQQGKSKLQIARISGMSASTVLRVIKRWTTYHIMLHLDIYGKYSRKTGYKVYKKNSKNCEAKLKIA